MFKKAGIFLFIIFFAGMGSFVSLNEASAQTNEPEAIPLPEPRTPLDEGKRHTLGFNLVVNNFGFGIGGQYSRIVGPYTQLTFSTGISAIKHASEQNFREFFTGRRIIPNKFNRVLSFPFMVGVKHRLFARDIADNFRFFVSGAGGPTLAFVFPYFNDINGNGVRDLVGDSQIQSVEPINDFFQGWDEGDTKWGLAGEVKFGVDFGENFSRLTTVEFGYFFYYFKQGIQIMEPRKVEERDAFGFTTKTAPFFDKGKFYGTPKISLIFGGMW